jgi:hypothetical protein
VAIVKNEADRIGQMIASASRFACAFTIVDTGSTDGTQQRAEEVGITVHERPWINFGVNRSEAFTLARGTADWLLALDADMTVEIDPDFDPDPAVDAYMIELGPPSFRYRLPLLLKGDLPWESRGAVHEYTTLPDRAYVGVPTDKVRITIHGDRSSPDKSRWHAALLEAELAEQPANARTVFYLAQTYWDLHDPQALAMYRRRSEMAGWDEETFYAKYRYAMCLSSWPAKMQALIAAWEFRPSRLEPLHEMIRELNRRSDHFTAYQMSQVSVEATRDNLFVHRDVWTWGMMFERSIAAWWVGRREECAELSEQVLSVPDLPPDIRAAAERNLSLC